MTKVLLAIPTWGGINPHVMLAAVHYGRLPNVEVMTSIGRPIGHNRNSIIGKFLADASFSHLWMWDNDTRPPMDALEKLLIVDAPVVTGCYPVWNQGLHWALYSRTTQGAAEPLLDSLPSGQPFAVRGAGAGCLLVQRKVFQEQPFPWFREKELPDGTLQFEDQWFFSRCHEAGILVMAHPGVVCDHYKEINLAELLTAGNLSGE